MYEETDKTDVKPNLFNIMSAIAKVKDEPLQTSQEFNFSFKPETVLIESSDEECNTLVELKNSCHVAFTKPHDMGLGFFIEMLTREMRQAHFITENEDFIVDCSIIRGEVHVQFDTCEYANLAMLLDSNIVYKGTNFKMVIRRLSSKDSPKCQNPNKVESIPNQDQAGENEINVPNEFISLESEIGTLTFIKVLIRNKKLFPQHGSFDKILERLRSVLINKSIVTTLVKMREQRERLRNSYTKCKRKDKNNCKHYAALDVIFGDSSPLTLRGTIYDVSNDEDLDLDDEPHPTVSEEGERKVASWTTDGAKALFSVCLDNQEDYDKPVSHSLFWIEVRQHC